ncbi:uncharacterized protein [Rutidosis leptorrhynchoides]|uniref:uncharacterized protein n=1 Tax=Rutidosis leptorrhynchoides TaxID=125765 RepID=UPI003A9A2ADD
MEKKFPSNNSNLVTMKNNLVPKKVEVFVWRAKRERLPVLSELDKRGIDLHSVLCPLCGMEIESVKHSLLSCVHVREIWEKVPDWWGFDSINLSFDNLLCGCGPSNCSDLGREIWQAVEWISGYLLWRNRNQKVFKKLSWTAPNALSEIQVLSFDWVVKRCKQRKVEWHDWLHNPSVYLV